MTIGTVNTAEFLVTVAESTTFILMLSDFDKYYKIILGLIMGGVIAAPIAAQLCKVIPARHMLIFVGTLVILLNAYKFVMLFI